MGFILDQNDSNRASFYKFGDGYDSIEMGVIMAKLYV